ncbi:MAG: DUF1298 domain-containing protein [Mycobacterium sp.]|uniref:wax ester/triacylglycerol synthase domain-containing protein n=1 Tax=Mycobacterium sp. TaxID=1785 RepID=UPI001EB4B3FA|nr:wax ester/triacylglycerol synthase domain-containing protein [Mycobacterium sp.]MBW0016282.1 DUF1298 domain-containing protein [Mycobacterium sp.]
MAQRTSLDACSRDVSAPDQHAGTAIGAVAIVNGTTPNYGLVKTVLAERIQTIHCCTQVWGTQWTDYPDFDLAQHVRHVALPRPGDEAKLFEAIANALARPIALDRPLWECWIIEGLKDNQWAILMKVHPRMADAISAAHLLARICDDAGSNAFTEPVAAKPVSSSDIHTHVWTDALWQVPAAAVGILTRAVVSAAESAASVIGTTPTGPTAMRRYSTVRIPITAVDSVCRKFGVATNDVAMAALTEGFRTQLLHRGQQPRADSFLTTGALEKLPVEHDDPVQRLRAVYQLRHARPGPHQSGRISDLLPFMLGARVIQLLTRIPQRGIVTLATSTPGPRHLLRLMDQPIKRLLPLPHGPRQPSTGVAVLSYGDELVFGITADYNAGPEMERLAAGIELGMARLVALSQDSVLLFTKDRRKRPSRASTSGAHRWRPSAPAARTRR